MARTRLKDKVAHVLSASQDRAHTCHWPGCQVQVPPAMWGCRGHWFALPKDIRDGIWLTYRINQEVSMTPSDSYLEWARKAQEFAESTTTREDQPP